LANLNTATALYNLTGPTSSTETAIAAAGSTTVRAVLAPPQDLAGGFFDGHPFKVRVVSQAVVTGAANFTVNVYANLGGNTNLTTFTNDVLIIGSGSQAAASKWATVFMEAIVMWDSVSQQLAAFWNAAAGAANIPTTPAVIKTSAAVTATNPVGTALSNISSVQFFVTHTLSANPTSSKLVELAIDRI